MAVETYENENGNIVVAPRRSLTEIEADRQRQAFDVGYPVKSKVPELVDFIARLPEREIPIYVRAEIQQALIMGIKADKPVKLEDVAPLTSLLRKTVSIKGKGRDEIVEIARVQPKPERRGLRGWLQK